jgi:hypothetical protein
MTRHQRTYVLSQTIIGAAVNFMLNALIGWAAYRSLAHLPVSGSPSIMGDLVVTAFVLPVLVCLIVTPLVRAETRHGKIEPLERSHGLVPRLLPRGVVVRGILLGVLAGGTIGLLTIGALKALGVGEMSFGEFVIFKAALGGSLAALITPVVVLGALMDPVPAASGPAGRLG